MRECVYGGVTVVVVFVRVECSIDFTMVCIQSCRCLISTLRAQSDRSMISQACIMRYDRAGREPNGTVRNQRGPNKVIHNAINERNKFS